MNEKKNIEWLEELTPEDARTLIDLVRMYQQGRRAAVKAIVTAIIGALVTAVGYGIVHWIRNLVLIAAAGIVIAALSGCTMVDSVTRATADKNLALGSDTWGGGGEVTMATPESPVPTGGFWFGRRKVWYISSKDAKVAKANAAVVRASNSTIEAGVGTDGIKVEQ